MDSPSGSRRLVPDLDAGDLLERFLVSAVGAILGIRAYLAATGYPQVGGDGLHIAHMLWGGVGMLIAVVLLLSFLGERVKVAAAIIGGLGFGTFVDELGKFITSDNNYFFEPTVAILYALFVALFLIFRSISTKQNVTSRDYLANAFDATRDALLHGSHERRMAARRKAIELLDRCNQQDPLVASLREALETHPLPAKPVEQRSNPFALARAAYVSFVRSVWVRRIVIGIFLLHGVGAVVGSIANIVGDSGWDILHPQISVMEGGASISSFLASLFAVIGVVRMRTSRLAAYEWFRRSTLVSIFLSQVFAFYREEFVALSSLAVVIVYLAALNFAISQEKRAQATSRRPNETTQAAPIPI